MNQKKNSDKNENVNNQEVDESITTHNNDDSQSNNSTSTDEKDSLNNEEDLDNVESDSQDKIKAWIKDQYLHPVETLHTFDEILKWFDEHDLEFISSIPQCNPYEAVKEKPFIKQSKGEVSDRIFSQILMLFNHFGSEGGLFIFVGKKR